MKKSLVATLFIPIILFISPFFFTESLALAATPADGIVSLSGCSGPDCTACNVVDMVNGGITWLIGILFVVFAVIMVIAGVGLVTSSGNQSALESAKSKFTNAIIGLIIILSAWLIVDTLMRGLVGNDGKLKAEGTVTGWLFWADVECQRVITPNEKELKFDRYDNGSFLDETGIPGSTSSLPVIVTGDLVTYAGARFDSGIVANVQYVAETFGLRVSGGYRTPERNFDVDGVPNSYHLTGRAADFVGTQSQMQAAQSWAQNNGAIEALIHNAGSGTHLHLAW
ncbi:hypothetical protein A2592_03360 [Candidatus Kaiserbacteria bacterium RIFOXYD1_FULL_42_15]|uniref:Peptidase M15A C-terminal domain-containing protein n=1 Tax=Candidatus Kaiserbacteria bacterium RIFOXYD1_FULL_42_15 TaxID=1798532 RepID=A0A1F6FPE4_9BACT|nr:MAG: hypothetical protein A2592_03360 [Candidatus Kaiserbacteria bacterium RIFOXYD1_FULL_42_15]